MRTRLDALVADLKMAAAEKGLTKAQIAEGAALHANTLRRFGEDGWNPSRSTLSKLELFLLPASLKSSRVPKRGGKGTTFERGGQVTSKCDARQSV